MVHAKFSPEKILFPLFPKHDDVDSRHAKSFLNKSSELFILTCLGIFGKHQTKCLQIMQKKCVLSTQTKKSFKTDMNGPKKNPDQTQNGPKI